MATLYRKYRPQSFKDILGQNHVKITLEHELDSDKIAHAYLFCGPRAVGKTTIARIMAKALNCTNIKSGEHEPCNTCDACKDITIGRSLDVMEIDAASHTGVDNVRESIIASARLAPSQYKYKVFIIDEVHMLSTSAFNALLKIIEEPPKNVIFILCTTEAHKVPATIISRCQRFDFKRISVVEVTGKLEYIAKQEGVIIDRKILEAIARQSEGHMRDAESLLGQLVSIGGRGITPEEADLVIPRSDLAEAINLVEYLKNKDAGRAIALVNRLVDEGVNLKVFLTDLVEIIRKIMLGKINPSLAEKIGLGLGETLEAKIAQASQGLELVRIVAFLEKFIAARNELRGSSIAQLPVEIAIASLCSAVPVQTVSAASASTARPAVKPFTAPQANSAPQPQNAGNNISDKAINLSLDEIKNRWSEVLARVKKYNHSLTFVLRVCEPRNIDGSKVCLAFKYKFHKDRIGEVSIKQIVEKVLEEVYCVRLEIETIIDETLEVSNNITGESAAIGNDVAAAASAPIPTEAAGAGCTNDGGDDIVGNLLATFGGKVIN